MDNLDNEGRSSVQYIAERKWTLLRFT